MRDSILYPILTVVFFVLFLIQTVNYADAGVDDREIFWAIGVCGDAGGIKSLSHNGWVNSPSVRCGNGTYLTLHYTKLPK